jgi:iron-sulfur cluster repair protein YtfE (RIC family)
VQSAQGMSTAPIAVTGPAGDDITSCLSRDHDSLDALLEEVTCMVADGELERADHTFGELRRDLQHHIRFEEEVLVPLFEERTGRTEGPTAVMRREHQAILDALDTIAAALDRGATEVFHAARGELLAVLTVHNQKEEAVLYPMLDQVIDHGECARLLARFRRQTRAEVHP